MRQPYPSAAPVPGTPDDTGAQRNGTTELRLIRTAAEKEQDDLKEDRSGCRGDNVLCPFECVAFVCSREKGVDFCFECGGFPCSKEIDPLIRERWLSFNRRMKEIGVVEFCQERSGLPRY